MGYHVDTWPCSICGQILGPGSMHVHGCERSNLPPAEMTAKIPSAPHPCPICAGTGRVPRDFYGETMNAPKQIVCLSCHGTGVLWQPAG